MNIIIQLSDLLSRFELQQKVYPNPMVFDPIK